MLTIQLYLVNTLITHYLPHLLSTLYVITLVALSIAGFCLHSGVVPSRLVKFVRRENHRWCVPPIDCLWDGARCAEG